MRKFVAFAVAVAAVPALVGPSFAQTEKKPAPGRDRDRQEAGQRRPRPRWTSAREAAVKSLTGEIVTMDQATRTVTVKHMVDKKAVQMTFNVEDTAVLTQFKAGDHVKVTYAEMGDKRIVRNIVKG